MSTPMVEEPGQLDRPHISTGSQIGGTYSHTRLPISSINETLRESTRKAEVPKDIIKRPRQRLFPSPSGNKTTAQHAHHPPEASSGADSGSAAVATDPLHAAYYWPGLSGGRASAGLRRAFIPKLYALDYWSPRLCKLLLPKYLLALDGECTAHLYRSGSEH